MIDFFDNFYSSIRLIDLLDVGIVAFIVYRVLLLIKGTRAMQEFLPNTYPAGGTDPCTGCPRGFGYLASNANSIRHAAQFQLRRRLRSGLSAIFDYTYAKSIDNAAYLGGQSDPGSTNSSGMGSPQVGGSSRSTARCGLTRRAK